MTPPENTQDKFLTFPATSGQKRLFFLSLLEGGEAPYHLPGVIKLKGSLSSRTLEQALRVLIHRHDCLRTGFIAEHEGVNQIVFSDVDFELKQIACSESDIENKLRDSVESFDLSKPPLLHASLLQTENPDLKYLVLDIHHIAADGISWSILLNDLGDIVNSKPLQPQPLSFVESTVLINQKSKSGSNAIHKKFWLDYFKEIPPPLNLPADHKRSPGQNFEGDVVQWIMEGETATGMRKTARTLGLSIHVFLMAIYATLLKSISGQDEFVITFPHSGRFDPTFESLAGMFAGTGLIKVNPGTQKSFTQLAKEIARETLTVFDHLEYPFEEIVENLNIERNLSRNPLSDISFVYETSDSRKLDLDGIETEFSPINKRTSFFDLTLDVSDNGAQLIFTFEYKSSLFNHSRVQAWCETYISIAKQLVDNHDLVLGQLAFMNEVNKELLLKGRNQTAAELLFGTVAAEIQRIVATNKTKTAIYFDDLKMSYLELGELTARVSGNLLRQHPERAGSIVVVVLNRSLHLPAILLGIWESGACFLPIDPSTPTARIKEIIGLSGSSLVITDLEQDFSSEKVINIRVQELMEEPTTLPDHSAKAVSPDSLAYIIYTSGTTGTPKGVKITHANLANYLSWAKTEYLRNDCSGDFPLFTSIAFDLTITSLLLPLLAGRSLYVQKKSLLANESLKEIFAVNSGMNAVKMTPSHALLLNDPSIQTETGIKLVILGGEAVQSKHLEMFSRFHPIPRIVNEYGPTETTVGVVAKDLVIDEHDIFIGKPIFNTSVYVLNELHEPVYPQSIGELYVGGKSVSPGYLNDSEATAEKFIPSPFTSDDTLYKTGDMVRWTGDGELEYLGRNDQQIKIRGHRIDPLEIQNALLDLDQIDNAAVIDKRDKAGRVVLVAYIVSDVNIDYERLNAQLSLKLPPSMIPDHFVQMDAIPLTANGKVDGKSLPEPDRKIRQTEASFIPADNSLEKTIVGVWEAVLDRSPIGATDNYFYVGGDSIQSIQIVSRMAEQGFKIMVRDVFEAPTPRRLAKRVKKLETQFPIDQSPVSGEVALAPIQKRFFRQNSFFRNHYTQAILLGMSKSVEFEILKEVLHIIHQRHDMLRARYRVSEGRVKQVLTDEHFFVQLDEVKQDDPGFQAGVESYVQNLAASMNLSSGPLLKSVLFRNDGEDTLLMVGHHLVIDAVSWSILIQDMNALYRQIEDNITPELPLRSHSYRDFVERGQFWLKTPHLAEKAAYWQNIVESTGPVIGNDQQLIDPGAYQKNLLQSLEYDQAFTAEILDLASSGHVSVQDILLAALEIHLESYSGEVCWSIDLEHFGRLSFSETHDFSRSVGWFTSIYPFRLERRHSVSPESRLQAINQASKANAAISHEYLLLRENNELPADIKSSELVFNYLGEIAPGSAKDRFYLKELVINGSIGDGYPRSYPFELEGWLEGGRLKLHLAYPESFSQSEIDRWWGGYLTAIQTYVTALQNEVAEKSRNQQLIQDFVSTQNSDHAIQAYYRLTPVQEGMLFYRLKEPESNVYHEVFRIDISGHLEFEKVQEAWNQVRKLHPILRTSFHASQIPFPIQVVHEFEAIPVEYADISGLTDSEQSAAVQSLVDREYTAVFDLSAGSLQHYVLVKRDDAYWTLIWGYPHILLDGWSTAIVLEDWFKIYSQICKKFAVDTQPGNGFEAYVNWYTDPSASDHRIFWESYLSNHSASFIAESVSEAPSPEPGQKLIETLSVAQSSILKDMAMNHELTLSHIVHLLWALVFGKQLGKSDVTFGSVKSVRPGEMADSQRTAGLFLTTLPVRISWLNETRFVELLLETRNHFIAREEKLRVSLTEIAAENIFDHILTVENYPINPDLFAASNESGGQIKILDVETFEATHFPLTIEVYLNETIEWHFLYKPELINKAMLQEMFSNIRKIIDSINQSPTDSISVLMEKIRSDGEISEETEFLHSISELNEDF